MSIVFLSYSHKDETQANDIAVVLSEFGIPFFQYVLSIGLGQSITGEVKLALDRCELLLVVVSRASLTSPWVPFEVGYATALGKRILPFVIDDGVSIPLYLRDFKSTADLKQVSAYLNEHKASWIRQQASSASSLLTVSQTRNLIEIHQASVAYHILRAIESSLDLCAEDPSSFDEQCFAQDLHAAIVRSRNKCLGFRSEVLGDLVEYFSARYPENELREHAQQWARWIREVGDSRIKRRRLVEKLEDAQTRVFAGVLEELAKHTEK